MKRISIEQAKKRAKLYLIISLVVTWLPLPSIVFGGLKYFSCYFYFGSKTSSPFSSLNNIPLGLIQYIYNKTKFLSFFWDLPPTPNPDKFSIFNYYYWLFIYGFAIYIGSLFMQRYKNLSNRIKNVERESEENIWRQESSGIQTATGKNTFTIEINLKSKNDFVGILIKIIIGVLTVIVARLFLLWFGLVR
jgi:hypothetical protein